MQPPVVRNPQRSNLALQLAEHEPVRALTDAVRSGVPAGLKVTSPVANNGKLVALNPMWPLFASVAAGPMRLPESNDGKHGAPEATGPGCQGRAGSRSPPSAAKFSCSQARRAELRAGLDAWLIDKWGTVAVLPPATTPTGIS